MSRATTDMVPCLPAAVSPPVLFSRLLNSRRSSCPAPRRSRGWSLFDERRRSTIRGQESDGEFFEHFTALSWKQENRRLQASRQDDGECRAPEATMDIPHREFHIGKREGEELYVEVLYTVEHKLGADGAFAEDLRAYAQKAFNMPQETHERLLAAARQEQPPIPVLNVTVLEARGLEAKDPNGYSDPYCMLGIRLGSDRRGSAEDEVSSGGGSLRRLGASLRQRGTEQRGRGGSLPDTLPAKFIRTTTVKPSTLNPRWNERFRLDIDDIHSDCLHLDVWDHDDESSVFDAARKLNEVTGLKGLNRYFKQVAQSARASTMDDFLGCIDVRLEDIPPAGLERWFPLAGRSHRSTVQGEIKLRLTLGTREDRGLQPPQDNWKEVVEHQQLLWIILEHELAHWQGPSESWKGDFPYAATAILDQHALQGDLTELQRAICRWVMFSRKHIANPLDLTLLFRLLQELDHAWQDADRALTRDELVTVIGDGAVELSPEEKDASVKEHQDRPGLSQYGPEASQRDLVSSAEEACLAESFGLFVDYCLEVLHRHREARSKLTRLLQCLSFLYRMKSFRRCCPFRNQLSVDVTGALKKAAHDWFQTIPLDPHGEVLYDLSALSALVNSLNRELQQGHDSYNAIFQEYVGVSYTAVMYKQLEKLSGTKLQHWVQTLCGTIDNNALPENEAMDHAVKVFELYMALKEFVGFREHLSPEDRENVTMVDFHQWFFHAVEGWFTVARTKARQRIRKALDVDQLKFVDSYVQHSTSAVDAVTCFAQIKEFWKQLAWPDLEGCYPFILKIVEAICDGAVFYAALCHQKLMDSGFYDMEGQFDVALQVCVVLNNMEHVRRALRPLKDELDVEELLSALEQERGEAVSYRCRDSLTRILQSAEDDIIHKILTVVAALSDKMRPEIKKNVFHLAWAPDKVDANSGLDPLVEYLELNLKTLYESLVSVNFLRTMEAVWRVVLQELTLTARSNLGEQLPFFRRLYAALEVLLHFFHGDDKGLSLKSLHSVAYQDLERLLRLHKSDTCYLIETYYMQRLEEQRKKQQEPGNNPNGYLTVFLCYNNVAESIRVDVVRARDLQPLDPNGFSDPFVILELLPKHLFPDCHQQKTKVQRKTLSPIFDESFEFPAPLERCRQEISLLRLTVMDYDVMLRDDFEGEAFVPLSDLPGIRAGEEDEDDIPRPLELPLLLPSKEKSEVLCALECRTWDPNAKDFVRQQKRRHS
ncbi:BAI1-associated protein 3-like isoform X2 [Ornithodoros turicata]|uniref:BAI1-associated protein 3-like isoform X2 n=1 Tax=Ornithodoros turicata TaxID=34597 RepID=UPI003139F3A6